MAANGLVDVAANVRVGISSFNSDSSGALIRLGIDDLDAAYKTTVQSTIK